MTFEQPCYIGFLVRMIGGRAIALYFNEKEDRFKYCYCDTVENGTFKDLHNLALIVNVIETRASFICPLTDAPIIDSESDMSDNGLQLFFDYLVYKKCGVKLYSGRKIIPTSKEEDNLLLLHVLKKLKRDDEINRKNHLFSLRGDTILSMIKSIDSRVREYNLNEILSEMNISIEEELDYRLGKDDYYYVYKRVSIGYPSEKLDYYLRKYIGLGSTCIHERHGYSSADEMSAEYKRALGGLILGELSKEDIDAEREKLISGYSVKEHIYYNISEEIGYNLFSCPPKCPSQIPDIDGLERNSLMPLFWKILNSPFFRRPLNGLEKIVFRHDIWNAYLRDVNELLKSFSDQTKQYRDISQSISLPLFPSPRYAVL